MPAWQLGQLGRFASEDPGSPRFELVGVQKEKRLVKVWYHLDSHSTSIPVDTFKRDCVNWWELPSAKGQLPIPEWVKKGALFQLEKREKREVQQWLNPRMILHAEDSVLQDIDRIRQLINGRDDTVVTTSRVQVEWPDFLRTVLRVRGTYMNYSSCIIPGTRTLVLVPLQIIAAAGIHRRTVWDRLGEDPFEGEEDALI